MIRHSVLHKEAKALRGGPKGESPSPFGRSSSSRYQTRAGTRLRLSFPALVATAALALFAAVGYGQTTAAHGPVDTSHGFPWYYQEAHGVQLEPCLDSNGACVLLADSGFNPSNVVSFPGNFPSEFFYYVVDSDKLTTPGCPASNGLPAVAPGLVKYRAAIEGTFLNGVVRAGEQITFGRTKIVASGLCPNQAYTFRHPYGTDTVTTNGSGQVTANQKIDIGCGALPCDFSLANNSRVLSGFLTSSGPKPAGYLGDSATLATVTGSPAGNNFFSVNGQGVNNLTTNLFTVAGRMAGPVMVTSLALDLGVVPEGSPLTKSVTVTNITGGNVPIGVSMTPSANSGDFRADGCPVALDATNPSCTLNVTFTPQTTSSERAQLQLGSQRSVDLAGTGTPSNAAAAVSLSAPSLSLGSMRVHGTSIAQTVTVKNAGSGTLGITASLLQADQFGIANDTCTGRTVAPGGTCSIGVTFSPTTLGDKVSALLLTDNAADSPQNVPLSGTGNGGVSAVSTTLSKYNFPDWYQDENAVQLQPCLNAADTSCVLLADANFNPSNPLAFGSGVTAVNFPSEAFYMVADSDKLTTPGCPAQNIAAGTAKYRGAIEAAFANGVARWGDQMTFTRTKIVASGLCPNTDYYFTHPYGKDLITTNDLGQVVANKKGGTIDTGCGGAPCNFADTLNGRVLGGYLKWDPAVAPAAPVGHLGDGAVGTLHTIVGSPFKDPVSGQPANLFRISDAHGNVLGETNLFTVAGLTYPTVTAPSPTPAPGTKEAITITLTQFRNDQLRWTVTGTDTVIANQVLTVTWKGTKLGTATVTTTGAWNFDIRGVAANLVPKAGDPVTVTAPGGATKSANVTIK